MAVFLILLICLESVSAGRESADWWKAQRDVNSVLMEGKTSIAELAANVSKDKPVTAQDAMFKLSVLMRAGMNKESIEALRELKALHPRMGNSQVACIYYDACDNVLAWDVAKATVEEFADNVSDLALDNRMINHFLNSGWTIEKVDEWLARMPEGTRNYWVKERLRFNVKHGRGEALVRELTDNVRHNPQDIEGAVALLDALAYARHAGDEEWNLSWMAKTLKPKRATEAERIASGLKTLAAWPTAVTFYKKAVDIPLTEEETRKLGILCAIFVPSEKLRAMFAVRAREALAECLLKLGRKDEAQKWMVEAADIRKEHDLGLNALFAGQVQAESGRRTLEGRIREEETKSESDPRYWRERARYYRGRNEPGREEEALL
jgi:tetratricopeptide (TPR) repeat protein